MPRRPLSIQEQLLKLESKKQLLLKARQQELLNIIAKFDAFAIDDTLLAGFLLFATNEDNKNNPLLAEIKKLAKTSKLSIKKNRKTL